MVAAARWRPAGALWDCLWIQVTPSPPSAEAPMMSGGIWDDPNFLAQNIELHAQSFPSPRLPEPWRMLMCVDFKNLKNFQTDINSGSISP